MTNVSPAPPRHHKLAQLPAFVRQRALALTAPAHRGVLVCGASLVAIGGIFPDGSDPQALRGLLGPIPNCQISLCLLPQPHKSVTAAHVFPASGGTQKSNWPWGSATPTLPFWSFVKQFQFFFFHVFLHNHILLGLIRDQELIRS